MNNCILRNNDLYYISVNRFSVMNELCFKDNKTFDVRVSLLLLLRFLNMPLDVAVLCSYQVFTPQSATAEEVVAVVAVTRGRVLHGTYFTKQINHPRIFYDLSSLNSSYSYNKKITYFNTTW